MMAERLRSMLAKRGVEAWYIEIVMRLFYGWYMVGAGSALQFLQAGLMTPSFCAYVAGLQAGRGWSKNALSGAAALQQKESANLWRPPRSFIAPFRPQSMIPLGTSGF